VFHVGIHRGAPLLRGGGSPRLAFSAPTVGREHELASASTATLGLAAINFRIGSGGRRTG